jgi:ribosomal protein S18 acetylase RimI-like enzyme
MSIAAPPPSLERPRASAFHVREAEDADSGDLIELFAEPTGGRVARRGVRWSIEHSADFFAALRADSGGWRSLIACDSETGRGIGCMSVATRRSYVGGRVRTTSYITHLHVRPEWRGRGVADGLCWRAHDLIRRSGGDDTPTLFLVHERNRSMSARVSGPRGLPDFRPIGRITIHSIPTRRLRSLAAPRRAQVAPATASDLPEMAALAAEVFAERDFAPALEVEALDRWIEGAPGLGLSDFLVAREAGRVVGWLGLWDDARLRVARVAGYTPTGRLRYALRDALSPLTGWRRAPRVGDPVGGAAAVRVCVPPARPDVLRALLRYRAGSLYESGRVRLKIALDPRDPLERGLSGCRARATPLLAYVTTPAGAAAAPALDGRPLHCEAALA